MNIADIRKEFVRKFCANEFTPDKSGENTVEIIGASFIADEDFIFSKPNKEYIEAEIAWYDSGSLNVEDLFEIYGKEVAIWKAVSDEFGYINSNYGWCIDSGDNCCQFDNCLETLQKDIGSRRACMIYTRPSMQVDYNLAGRSDFMCTHAVNYLVRDGKLDAIVQMRSNDAVFGFLNDLAWQKEVQAQLAANLEDVTPGDIHWQVSSLHVYERHFRYIKE